MPTRAEVVAEAKSWVGTPYHHQAQVKGAGVDCVNLLCGVYGAVMGCRYDPDGVYSPQWHLHQAEEKMLAQLDQHALRISTAAVQPGDFLTFRAMTFGKRRTPAGHSAIMSFDGRIIHASIEVGRVVENRLPDTWKRLIAQAYFVPGVI